MNISNNRASADVRTASTSTVSNAVTVSPSLPFTTPLSRTSLTAAKSKLSSTSSRATSSTAAASSSSTATSRLVFQPYVSISFLLYKFSTQSCREPCHTSACSMRSATATSALPPAASLDMANAAIAVRIASHRIAHLACCSLCCDVANLISSCLRFCILARAHRKCCCRTSRRVSCQVRPCPSSRRRTRSFSAV